jgi:DeoR/GlpR family transcriptional regulator of sugar metabolism
MAKRRLKRHDLVESLFVLFSSEYDGREVESILDFSLPIETVKTYLRNRFDVTYKGSEWIYTQIRNYEEEIGYPLFDKETRDAGNPGLRLHPDMVAFEQKRHLYITQKIKVSNAVLDLIINTAPLPQNGGVEITLLIDAGSTMRHFADALAEGSLKKDAPVFNIYTHNISVIGRLLRPPVESGRIRITTPQGRIDHVTNAILGNNLELYAGVLFDYVIVGTSFLFKGRLWVELEEESTIKRRILRETRGPKLLVLTGHEVRRERPLSTEPFGELIDFDLLVIPYNSTGILKNMDAMLAESAAILTPEIINWNYRIYRIRRRI